MKIESINVAEKTLLHNVDGPFATGICKRPVASVVAISLRGLAGDTIVDTSVHGGFDQAVYFYKAEDYEWWCTQLGKTIAPGTFGENITISGLGDRAMVIGDRLKINNVVLEVSAPRTPCFKLAARMEDVTFVKKFVKAARPGFYARVIEEGEIGAGDAAELISAGSDYATVDEVFVEWHAKNRSRSVLEKALASPLSLYHKIIISQWLANLST